MIAVIFCGPRRRLRWPRRGVPGPAAARAAGARGRGAHGNADRGDSRDGVGPAVVAVEVAGGGALDLAGAEARPPCRGSIVARTARPMAPVRSAGPSGQTPAAAVSCSRAASRVVVKLARAGSVPGTVSTAVTHRHTQQLAEAQRGLDFLLDAGPVAGTQHQAVQHRVARRPETTNECSARRWRRPPSGSPG